MCLWCFGQNLAPDALKGRFNEIETEMGRDRSNPERKLIDHTIDIDILQYNAVPRFDGDYISEPYFKKLFDDQFEENDELESLSFAGGEIGMVPVSVFFTASRNRDLLVRRNGSVQFDT